MCMLSHKARPAPAASGPLRDAQPFFYIENENADGEGEWGKEQNTGCGCTWATDA